MLKSAHTALSVHGGALAFEPVTFAKTPSSHRALGAFILPAAGESVLKVDFGRNFGYVPAMQVGILAEFLCFGTVFDLILFRLQGQRGERFGGVSLGCFLNYAEATWSK